ncbi:MAG: S1-like domain-containing RNA-binding protein [Bacilli bacterium]|nr:S1-like domain-containing RNA-binding protein [Bacilli bacterium]
MESLGTIKKYQIIKETPLGYMISCGKCEYFLHRAETAYQQLKIGDSVEAFIYLDKKGRLAATLHRPMITVDTFAFVPVVEVLKNVGVFVDIAISKDVLVSGDDLPKSLNNWPHPGDRLLCKLKVKAGRLLAKPLIKEEVPAAGPETELIKGVVTAYVIKIFAAGLLLANENYLLIYVHSGEQRKDYRLGQKLDIKIIGKNENGYQGSIKTSVINLDGNLILDYLKKNHGVMTITEKSSPEVIYRVFKISKKAFKNALGRLYKEKRIDILPDKIILLKAN